ncbi:acylphosphatase [Cognatiluteimonas weifangensis]|uniref:Acylphosphatase n=1 Tax=Cognatiluteimonas weifangensis TaxID=2303539 RepID=A0A372DIF4_9GAMM|nr:acylphosphatase [Luteimonas weifangensis]RFP59355.1 acylphosphatase [Luteimonas weifangensis]
MDRSARFLISGKVQGVCFRASTHDAALRLGLRGYARNLPDGRVEVLATGDAAALDALAQWLQHGPPLARVDAVERHEADRDGAVRGFEVG